jgi:hypothetical protein
MATVTNSENTLVGQEHDTACQDVPVHGQQPPRIICTLVERQLTDREYLHAASLLVGSSRPSFCEDLWHCLHKSKSLGLWRTSKDDGNKLGS